MQTAIHLLNMGWPGTALSALIAVLVMLALCKVVTGLAIRFGHRFPTALTLIEGTRGPMRCSLVLLTMQFVWDEAPNELRFIGALRHATSLGLIAALTWLGLRTIVAGVTVVTLLRPTGLSDNLHARRLRTQTEVLSRVLMVFAVLIGVSCALMTFPSVRQIGASLLASAGVAGLVAGLAARPVLSNVIAGIQIAFTQPIRIDDVLVIEGEWGRVEQITGAFVVIKIWDERRLVVPLQWFIEHPFQNWTRTSAEIIGTVFLWLDYQVAVDPLRTELTRICNNAPEWDGRVALLQVSDASERCMQLRALVSSADSSRNWDLRCRVREALIDYVSREYPGNLPRLRATVDRPDGQVSQTVGSDVG